MKSLNSVCEAQKCFAEATTLVRVSAGIINGHQIAIPLSLCDNCVRKFDVIKEEGLALYSQTQNGTVYGKTADNRADGQANNVINT
jgi:hypothetical protein